MKPSSMLLLAGMALSAGSPAYADGDATRHAAERHNRYFKPLDAEDFASYRAERQARSRDVATKATAKGEMIPASGGAHEAGTLVFRDSRGCAVGRAFVLRRGGEDDSLNAIDYQTGDESRLRINPHVIDLSDTGGFGGQRDPRIIYGANTPCPLND